MTPALLLLAAYLLGGVPSGLLLGRLAGVDPRRTGSGNTGAANLLRAAGPWWGLLTLLADSGKTALPVVIALFLEPEMAAWAGLAAVVGHCYPVYLGFRGGKGVASALGMLLVLNPPAAAVGAGLYVLGLGLTRRSSVGALAGAAGATAWVWLAGPAGSLPWAMTATLALILLRHKDNLVRLAQGREPALTFRR